jgi:hypothetical protein
LIGRWRFGPLRRTAARGNVRGQPFCEPAVTTQTPAFAAGANMQTSGHLMAKAIAFDWIDGDAVVTHGRTHFRERGWPAKMAFLCSPASKCATRRICAKPASALKKSQRSTPRSGRTKGPADLDSRE